jgi:hypothetical protein
MDSKEIRALLHRLNEMLEADGLLGEISIYGGAVMALALNAREGTYDIDAIFAPKQPIQEYIKAIADEYGLPSDWLNDAVKGFVSSNNDIERFDTMSNLNVYVAKPEYMLAMKAISARTENLVEISDIEFLLRLLEINDVEAAERVIAKYYPKDRILPKTHYLLEEIIARMQ